MPLKQYLTIVVSLWALCALQLQAQEREIADLAGKLREQIAKERRKVVAILPLSNVSYGPDFSNYVVDELTTQLVQGAPGFRIVTRARLEQLIKEKELKFARGFDLTTFQKLGQFAGADTIITGSYSLLAATVKVSLQVLDVSDGTILAAASSSLPKTADIDGLVKLANPMSPTISDSASGAENASGALAFGPFRRDPRKSPALGGIQAYNNVWIFAHGCERSAGRTICLLAWKLPDGDSRDWNAKTYPTKLVDSQGADYKQTSAYFLTSRGQQQNTMNIGPGDTRYVVNEFEDIPKDVVSVKIIHGGLQIKGVPVW